MVNYTHNATNCTILQIEADKCCIMSNNKTRRFEAERGNDMKKNIVKKACKSMLVKAAYKCAEYEVNVACPWYNFQPEIPTEAKKLKKHV